MDCLFCKIVKDEIDSVKVFEDDYVIAFLDIHPIRLGHTLVIPKKHEPDFYKLEDEYYIPLMDAVKKLANKIEQSFKPKRVGILVAGWDVPHAHIHIVPMHDYDDLTSKIALDGKKLNLTGQELKKLAEKLK